jgi:hypothetical protein
MKLTANQTIALRWLSDHSGESLYHRSTIIAENGLTDAEYDLLVSYLASRQAVSVIPCDDQSNDFQLGPTFHSTIQELLSPICPPSTNMPKLSETEIACLRVIHQQYEAGLTSAKFRDNAALADNSEAAHVIHRLSTLWPDNPPCELQTRGSYYIRPGIADVIARLDNPPLPDKLGDTEKRWRASTLSIIVVGIIGLAALLAALVYIAEFIMRFF